MDEQLAAHILASLGRVEGSLSTLVGQVAAHEPRINAAEKAIDAQDREIEMLKRGRWKQVGAFAAVSFFLAALAALAPFVAR